MGGALCGDGPRFCVCVGLVVRAGGRALVWGHPISAQALWRSRTRRRRTQKADAPRERRPALSLLFNSPLSSRSRATNTSHRRSAVTEGAAIKGARHTSLRSRACVGRKRRGGAGAAARGRESGDICIASFLPWAQPMKKRNTQLPSHNQKEIETLHHPLSLLILTPASWAAGAAAAAAVVADPHHSPPTRPHPPAPRAPRLQR